MTGDWHFRQFRPGDTINDPIERALFSQESVTGHPASALVREAIQNSLDARPGNKGKATVKFVLRRGETAPSMQEMAPLLRQLLPRLGARNSGIAEVPRDRTAVPLLTVEDFGTTGLTGDPEAWEPSHASDNPFYLFFRALGRSGKSGEQRGRWGVGKFVFPLASQANCWFGYTRTRDPERELLMGRCVLKTHELDSRSWHPDGTWGEGRAQDDFVRPLAPDNLGFLPALRALRLDRREQPGLSVVVPWIREEVTGTALRDAVAREYFLPVIRGDLEVLIQEGNDSTLRIADESLDDVVAHIGDAALSELVGLARAAHGMPASAILRTASAMVDRYPRWRDDLLGQEQIRFVNERLEAGSPFVIRVPFDTRPQGGDSERTHVDIALQTSSLAAPVAPLVIREGITIPDAKARRIHGFACLVLVDDRPIASLVGDAESPSHTQLLHDLLRDKYVFGKRYLAFLREAPAQIVKTLSGTGAQEDQFLLASYFPATVAGHASAPRKTKRPGKQSPLPDLPPRTPPRFHVRKAEGGFSVSAASGATQLPAELAIAVAYEVRRGNPFKKYREFDFVLGRGGIEVRAEGAEVEDQTNNKLRLLPLNSDFRLEVSGFDPNRNLVVRVSDA